ncbi:MAG: hypothetical protein B7Z41_05195 [Rhizobiales bacterium 12-66-7]|nr:MAG: hypothetical protein B7Z41_05195 [Rhizobiales bacterium 12-66-7]
MTISAITPLADLGARVAALTQLDRTLLVEAGAGSGKTAILAGRILMLLARNVPPKAIAAITFTELAASQLLERVTQFVDEVLGGEIRADLRPALPSGLSATQRAHLESARAHLDEITASTIHGFCQSLIKPYPVEASLDPGSGMLDPANAMFMLAEILDTWLRERLSGAEREDDMIATLVLLKPNESLDLFKTLVAFMVSHRSARVAPAAFTHDLVTDFCRAVANFRAFLSATFVEEGETEAIVTALEYGAAHVAGVAKTVEANMLGALMVLPEDGGLGGSYRKQGKWQAAAKAVGLSASEGKRLSEIASLHHAACRETYETLRACAAGRVLERLGSDLSEVLERYAERKRLTAGLDFDDLLFAAWRLLREHEPVRQALGQRYAHVLVDEFQDTDPLQTEILLRLTGEPPVCDPSAPLENWSVRPGALFLVGDPKQAIYRFRGADVAAYVGVRETLRRRDPTSIIAISTNFRSVADILHFVNGSFSGPLSDEGQPGFAPLEVFHAPAHAGPFVACLPVEMPLNEKGKASAEMHRTAEAGAVAALCARIIGSLEVRDRSNGTRLCRAGDIALLAPAGTDLWRYEQALDDLGIPVASQAGKSFFQRQEVQDLIAMTRALADARDTLALGALLRGPLVGLSEEQLLDMVSADPDTLGMESTRLHLWMAAEEIGDPLARHILQVLQSLARQVPINTPYALLSQAVEELRVRSVLRARHGDGAERTLANVDLFLEMSHGFAGLGLRAFALSISSGWDDAQRTAEGRPDSEADAVSLITMHSAKGLEWPVVIPVNTMSAPLATGGVILDRATGIFTAKAFGIAAPPYAAIHAGEVAEREREQMRLWYVAATRAMDLLLLPSPNCGYGEKSWSGRIGFPLEDLPRFDMAQFPHASPFRRSQAANQQDRETFAAEAATIAANHRSLLRVAPSRIEGDTAVERPEPRLFTASDVVDETPELDIRGGRERGLVMHKLFEEVLTGECEEDPVPLEARAAVLIMQLDHEPADAPSRGLCPRELAACVLESLRLPEIAAVRDHLVPEFPIYAAKESSISEQIVFGIADALLVGPAGTVALIVDWKTDVSPETATLQRYRQQVQAYCDATQAKAGILVSATHKNIL